MYRMSRFLRGGFVTAVVLWSCFVATGASAQDYYQMVRWHNEWMRGNVEAIYQEMIDVRNCYRETPMPQLDYWIATSLSNFPETRDLSDFYFKYLLNYDQLNNNAQRAVYEEWIKSGRGIPFADITFYTMPNYQPWGGERQIPYGGYVTTPQPQVGQGPRPGQPGRSGWLDTRFRETGKRKR